MGQIRAELEILTIILVERERETAPAATDTAHGQADNTQTFTSFDINYPFSLSSYINTLSLSLHTSCWPVNWKSEKYYF